MRLIDADALIAAHKEVCSRSMKFNLDLAPTIDAVPVVRCRECENWDIGWEPSHFNPDNPRHYCAENDLFPTGDWFCKDGKRREDGLYESLKRGLEEAIAYENGEIESRTEIREDGDGDG